MAKQGDFQREIYYAGSRIFKEGDPGNAAYLIESGKIEISRNDNGNAVVLGTLGPKEIFGEMALVDDAPRMATAKALEDTVCYIVLRRVFDEKLAKSDPFIVALLRLFARNLRKMNKGK